MTQTATTSTSVVHEVGVAPKRFETLATALGYVSDRKFNGYVVAPDHTVIVIKNGKRRSADGKRWVRP